MAEITCKQCGHVNEGERVYCHSCGAKLERNLLPEEAKPDVTPEKERKRIRKLTRPPYDVARDVSTVSLVLLWSIVAAALIQIARPPDDVPPMPKERVLDAPQMNFELEQALSAPIPQQLALTEDAINAYLQNRIKPGEAGLAGTVKFDRVFVRLENGVCRIVSQRSFLDNPLYGSILYQLAIEGNKLQATCVGGYFGRLPVHPKIMRSLAVIYSDLWEQLKSEQKVLGEMASIEVGKTIQGKRTILIATNPAKK